VAGAASGGLAFADPTPPPGTSTPKSENPKLSGDAERRAGAAKVRPRARQLARRTLHGEFVVKGKDGKFVTVLTQKGQVTTVDARSVTVRSEDGFSRTYAVDGDTRVRRERAKATIGDVKTGDRALVVADRSGTGATARTLVVRAPGAGD
jgi:hypothetical protein